MTDNIGSLILEHLRYIRGKVDQIADDMSSLESAMVSVKHEAAHGDETDARQQPTLDKIVAR